MIKYCKDCKWLKENSFTAPRSQCWSGNVAKTFNLVTGAQIEVDCFEARSEASCGLEGIFWEPK